VRDARESYSHTAESGHHSQRRTVQEHGKFQKLAEKYIFGMFIPWYFGIYFAVYFFVEN